MMSKIIIILCLVSIVSSDIYVPARTRIVDSIGKTILVRGNEPLNSYGKSVLPQILKDIRNKTGIHYENLIDVSLLNPYNHDNMDLQKEKPMLDILVIKEPVYGIYKAPSKKYYEEIVNSKEFQEYMNVVELLHFLMKTQESTIIYVHCEQGTDRTGAVIGAYRLDKGDSWEDISQDNYSIQNRHLMVKYENLLDWWRYNKLMKFMKNF